MCRNFKLALHLLLLFLVVPIKSKATSYTSLEVFADSLSKVHPDSLDSYYSYFSLFEEDSIIVIADNPYYFRLFFPLTVYSDAIRESSVNNFIAGYDSSDTLLRIDRTGFDNDIERYRTMNRALSRIYIEMPDQIRYLDYDIMSQSTASHANVMDSRGIDFNNMVQGNEVNVNEQDVDLVSAKPSYWRFPGYLAVKFSQNAYSQNWYKGGESNNQLAAELRLEANYAKNKVTWNNMLEAKLGYYSSEVDGKYKFRPNSDLFRITSKFGLQAAKSWYYSSQLQAYTQFLPVHDDNGLMKSRFCAPAYASFSIGLDYKPKFKKKGIELSAQISPLAYNCRYVNVDRLAPNYGIQEGHYLSDIGSRVEANIVWTIFKNFTWRGKAHFFTSYKNVEASTENTFKVDLNRFFSLQLFVHWRFDDKVKPDERLGYNQINENFSLNFNYSW